MMHEHVEKAEANSASLSDSDPTALRYARVSKETYYRAKETYQY